MSVRLPPPPHRVFLGGAPRQPGRLDQTAAALRSLDAIGADLRAAPSGDRILLAGGEPTLRKDLLKVLSAAGRPAGLRTDGLALTTAQNRAAVRRAGAGWLRIPLHSSRRDAHDWLVGRDGAAHRTMRTIRDAAAEGWRVEVEITLTRPTTPHLPETVALAGRLGARGVWLRRLRAEGPAADDWIALSPRLGLIRAAVEEAAVIAANQNVHLWIAGLPACFIPAAADHIVPTAEHGKRCPRCPGSPQCDGVGQTYAERFGWAEVRHLMPPPTRASVTLRIDADEPTRAARQRMVLAARSKPQRLRLIGVTTHPEMLSLLRDALRLSIPTVEVEGPVGQLSALTDRDLFRLRGLSQVRLTGDGPAVQAFMARAAGTLSVVSGFANPAQEDSADLLP
ncbi:MAG: hypothetical protein AAFV53_29615 [Myxococcota bacterium]